ncbi:MAG: radical SAM protein [Proteobacteria bacterium]|nr:radical SAM protein [Pseudomonadota bacterium]
MTTIAPVAERPRPDIEERRRRLRALPAPEPVPTMATYVAEREKALAASPKRRENYERYLASMRRSATVDYLPIKLDIENVSRCNFRCTMCVVSDWKKGQRAEDMPVEDFKRLIDEQYGLVEIKLQGIGEPTMQRDPYFEMIRYARARHIWVRTTTNASLLHLKDNHRKLIDTGVNEVQISVDGADKGAFEKIRRGSVFERVTANCKLINAYCREKGVDRTKMWTVVQRDNCHQLPELVDLAGELGFKRTVFSLELSDWGLADWNERNNRVNVEDTLDPDTLMTLVERGARQGVTVRFWNVTSKYSTESLDKLCAWPFERAYVSSDRRVVPCCYIGNPDVFQIGDKPLGSFTEVWQSKAYEDFRRDHLEGRIPKVCEGCYLRNAHGEALD